MTKKDTRPDAGRKTPERPRESRPLCPQCGEPIETCNCAQRWENEGGAPDPRETGTLGPS